MKRVKWLLIIYSASFGFWFFGTYVFWFLVFGFWFLSFVFLPHLTGVRNYWSELCASKTSGNLWLVTPHSVREGQIGGPL